MADVANAASPDKLLWGCEVARPKPWLADRQWLAEIEEPDVNRSFADRQPDRLLAPGDRRPW
ncbi:hypothetical protein [Streptomyces flaveolus]|uniref:hypothetical protein n=1 Tax=Streptomyces flaveolus TaxID=67297 RepID=UPI0038052761